MGPKYQCSTCGRCYVRDHTPFVQHGRWFWRGPCGVKYAFPERPDLPCNGQVLFNGETHLQSAPDGPVPRDGHVLVGIAP